MEQCHEITWSTFVQNVECVCLLVGWGVGGDVECVFLFVFLTETVYKKLILRHVLKIHECDDANNR